MSSCNVVNASVSSGFIIKGVDGKDGISPQITVEEDTESSYKLKITDVNGTFITPNLKGSGGGLDSNTLEEIKNKVEEANRNANLAIENSFTAVNVAQNANQTAQSAQSISQQAQTTANSAKELAQRAYDLAQSNIGKTDLVAGENIEIKDNVISVLTTNNAEEDNTRPITSAGVNTIVGNIDILLKII